MNEGLNKFVIAVDSDNEGFGDINSAECARQVNAGSIKFWRKRGMRGPDEMLTMKERIHAEISEQKAVKKMRAKR